MTMSLPGAVTKSVARRLLIAIACVALLVTFALLAFGLVDWWFLIAASAAAASCILYALSLKPRRVVRGAGSSPEDRRNRSYVHQNGIIHLSFRRYLAEVVISTLVLSAAAVLLDTLVVFVVSLCLLILVIGGLEIYCARKQAFQDGGRAHW